jgi:hypothetical protein
MKSILRRDFLDVLLRLGNQLLKTVRLAHANG